MGQAKLPVVFLSIVLTAGMVVFFGRTLFFSESIEQPSEAALGANLLQNKLIDEAGAEVMFDAIEFNSPLPLRASLLVFWATWCAPCIEEIPLILDRQKNYDLRGVRTVFINFDNGTLERSKRNDVREWLRKNNIVSEHQASFETFFDPQENLLKELNVTALPYNVLMDALGNVVWAEYGELSFEELDKAIQTLANGR